MFHLDMLHIMEVKCIVNAFFVVFQGEKKLNSTSNHFITTFATARQDSNDA